MKKHAVKSCENCFYRDDPPDNPGCNDCLDGIVDGWQPRPVQSAYRQFKNDHTI